MRKLSISACLLVNLLLVFCTVGLVSCSDNEELSEEELSEEENPQGDFWGYWYYSNGNQIYCISFSEDGTGVITGYTYSEKQWSEQTLSLQYTLSDNTLTIKPSEGDAFAGKIGIVGNSMSFTYDDSIIMLTRYDGSEEKINELKQDIESSWQDTEPSDTIISEDSYITEEDILTAIAGVYSKLSEYEYKQMLLEKIRLTQKDFYDQPASINSSSAEVYDAWEAAYAVVDSTNFVIAALETGELIDMDEQKIIAYANEARALRCMVYYNLAQLWENVPYVTDYFNNEILPQYQILSSQDMYHKLNSILQDIDVLPEGENRITVETVKALRGEIALSLGCNEEAVSLLSDCHSDFSILVDEQLNPDMYQIFGDKVSNYTSDKTELLLQEAEIEEDDEALLLIDDWKNKKQYWGYWIMLKRTKLAQAVAGCREYEVLMPIPMRALEMLPNLTQNPGY